MLLHGLSDSWRSFELLLPHLPESIHAFALSLRDHGDTGHPESGYRPGAFAEDVAAFMDALEIGRAVIVGDSMGSLIAQRFALDYPERVIGLALLGAIPSLQTAAEIKELHAAIRSLGDPVDPEFIREFQQSTIVQPVPPAFVDTIVHESQKSPARVWRATVDGCIADDFSDRLSAIGAPTVFIWGDKDSLFSRSDQEALLAAIPNARLVVYAGTGHTVHWEQPQRIASDLIAFVNTLGH